MPQLVKMTKCGGEREERELAHAWIYPRDRARRKVEREGEPKQR